MKKSAGELVVRQLRSRCPEETLTMADGSVLAIAEDLSKLAVFAKASCAEAVTWALNMELLV